jgi:hypothetical protein
VIVRQDNFARHLGAGGLRIVIVEDQPVDVARQIFYCAGYSSRGRKILAPQQAHVHSALVHKLIAHLPGLRVGCRLLDSAVKQRIPARSQVVEPRTPVTEVAIRRPSALAVVLGADHQIHTAVDNPVGLFAKCEAAN